MMALESQNSDIQSNNGDPVHFDGIEKGMKLGTLGLDIKSNFSITPKM